MLNLRKLLVGVLLASLATFALADGGDRGGGTQGLPVPVVGKALPS
jgi:hypothetical protein